MVVVGVMAGEGGMGCDWSMNNMEVRIERCSNIILI